MQQEQRSWGRLIKRAKPKLLRDLGWLWQLALERAREEALEAVQMFALLQEKKKISNEMKFFRGSKQCFELELILGWFGAPFQGEKANPIT